MRRVRDVTSTLHRRAWYSLLLGGVWGTGGGGRDGHRGCRPGNIKVEKMTRMHPLPTFSSGQLRANVFIKKKGVWEGSLTASRDSVQAEMIG